MCRPIGSRRIARRCAGHATRAKIVLRWRGVAGAVLLPGLCAGFLAGPLTTSAFGEPAWTTYHRDPARSGVDPDAVEPIAPTLSWQSVDLGAAIWGQPLILGSRVYVATVGNAVYALDASTGKVLWKETAGTPVPAGEVGCEKGTQNEIVPTVGIVGTPVIDVSTNTLFAVADRWINNKGHHMLEGFRLSDGKKVSEIPVDPPEAEPGSEEPRLLLERPALNLAQGKVVFGFGGIGDCGVYHGAVVATPQGGGAPVFWRYAPAHGGGAVWGASGPAVDGEGNIYASTGNPNLHGAELGAYDYSDSVLKLSSSMSLLGHFAPPTWMFDSTNDLDLGSSGPELLPGGLLFQAGKNEMGYLIDEAAMGSGAPPVYSQKVCGARGGSLGGDAFAAGTIYVPCTDGVRALTYHLAARTFTPLWRGPADATGPPIVSGGLVWVVSGKFLSGGGTKLYALDPSTGVPRYTETLPAPVIDHFASPSSAAGRVFLATGTTVTAYQIGKLSSEPPAITRLARTSGPVSGGTELTVTGTNFTGVTAVRFGSTSASSFIVRSTTAITAVSPMSLATGAGTVDVTITASGGTSALSSKDHFTFRPTITGISPNAGTQAGGTRVTVTGTGFALGTAATVFTFGAAKAKSVDCSAANSCTVVVPAHAVGTVDAKATVNKASTPKAAPADQFTYN
jgi:outer membrane protein assembly factor BamB